MSIVFVPNIDTLIKYRKTEKPQKAKRERRAWEETELLAIAYLRAAGLSFDDIAKRIKRPKQSCSHVVHSKDLYKIIEQKRAELIEGIMGDNQ